MTQEENKKSNDQKEQDRLIIDRPEALSPMRKGMELTVTAIGWFIWAVLCRPLLLVFLWFVGFQIFYEHMIRLGGFSALIDFGFIYMGAIFALYLIIRGWNFYNAKKFKNKERRKSDKLVTAQDLENFFEMPPHSVDNAREWKNVTVTFAENHQIILAQTGNSNPKKQAKGLFRPT